MPAGQIFTGKIWRMQELQDDAVGGSVPTGTVIYNPVYARVSSMKPTQALLEQGLETPEIFSAILYPGGMALRHNDQFEVTGPQISSYLGKRFVIIGLQHSSMEDARRYQVATLRRLEVGHSNALQ